MRNLLFPAVSALALLSAAGPLLVQTSAAQTASTMPMSAPMLSASQQTDYDTWSPDQRTAYGAWPANYQAYYWTLTPNQMHGWWRLSAVQRGQIMALSPEQQVSAWTSIEAQLAGQPAGVVQANPVGSNEPASATPPDPMAANDPVPPATPADTSYSAGPYKGALTAPPTEAMNKTYPVCTKKLQDSCRNRGGK